MTDDFNIEVFIKDANIIEDALGSHDLLVQFQQSQSVSFGLMINLFQEKRILQIQMPKTMSPGPKLLIFKAGLYTCILDIEQQLQDAFEFKTYQSTLTKLSLVSPQNQPGVEINCSYLISVKNQNPRLQKLKARLNNIPSKERAGQKLISPITTFNQDLFNSNFPSQPNPFPPLVHSPVVKNSPTTHTNKIKKFDGNKKTNGGLIDWNKQSVREGAQWKRGNGPLMSAFKKSLSKEPDLHTTIAVQDLNRTLQPMNPPIIKNREQKHISFIISDSFSSPDKNDENVSSPKLKPQNSPRWNQTFVEDDNLNELEFSSKAIKPSSSAGSNISLDKDIAKILSFSDSDEYF